MAFAFKLRRPDGTVCTDEEVLRSVQRESWDGMEYDVEPYEVTNLTESLQSGAQFLQNLRDAAAANTLGSDGTEEDFWYYRFLRDLCDRGYSIDSVEPKASTPAPRKPDLNSILALLDMMPESDRAAVLKQLGQK